MYLYTRLVMHRHIDVYLYIYIYTLVGQKLRLLNMLDSFLCTPFPLRILARSGVVPRSNFHPPKAFYLIDVIEGDNLPSTPATRTGLGNVIRG